MSQENRPYGKRLRSERARLEFNQTQVAIAGKVSKTTQIGYEANAHVPDLDYVNNLEEIGIDRIFLLTGVKKSTFVTREFNWNLLGEILEASLEWAEENNRQIPPKKFADLLHMLYEQFSETNNIETQAVSRALRLVA